MHLPVPDAIQSFIPNHNNHTLLGEVGSVTDVLNPVRHDAHRSGGSEDGE